MASVFGTLTIQDLGAIIIILCTQLFTIRRPRLIMAIHPNLILQLTEMALTIIPTGKILAVC